MSDPFDLDRRLDQLAEGKPADDGDTLIEAAKTVVQAREIVVDDVRKRERKEAFLARAAQLRAERTSEAVATVARVRLTRWRATSRKIVALAAVVLMSSGASVVYAATGSMPGSPLYGIKRASERMALYLAPAATRPSVEKRIAEERDKEARYMSLGEPVRSGRKHGVSLDGDRGAGTKDDQGSGNAEPSKKPDSSNSTNISPSSSGKAASDDHVAPGRTRGSSPQSPSSGKSHPDSKAKSGKP